jgi:hypothetical protein
MPIVAQIVCDVCQAVKKDTNHWYTLAMEDQLVCMRPLELPPDGVTNNLSVTSAQYVCGRFCAIEAITKWMDSLSEGPSRDMRTPTKSPLAMEKAPPEFPQPLEKISVV